MRSTRHPIWTPPPSMPPRAFPKPRSVFSRELMGPQEIQSGPSRPLCFPEALLRATVCVFWGANEVYKTPNLDPPAVYASQSLSPERLSVFSREPMKSTDTQFGPSRHLCLPEPLPEPLSVFSKEPMRSTRHLIWTLLPSMLPKASRQSPEPLSVSQSHCLCFLGSQ